MTNDTNGAPFFFLSFSELSFELLLSCLQVTLSFLAVLSKQRCVEFKEKKKSQVWSHVAYIVCLSCGAIYGSGWKSDSQQGKCVEGPVCVAQGFPFVYPRSSRLWSSSPVLEVV